MKTLFMTLFSVLLTCTTLFASYDHTIQGQIIEFYPELPDSYRDVIFRSDEFTLDTLTQLDDTGYFSLTFFVDTEITSSVRVDVIYIDPCTGEPVTLEVEVITEGVTELEFPACGDPIDCYAGFIPDYQGGDRLTISFIDESWTPDIVAVHWDFGDGTTSSAFNPAHTYAEGGEYLVRYEIITADSCTAVAESYVYPGNLDWHLQCVAFIYYDQSDFSPQNIHFFAEVGLEPIQLEWNFGDGNTSNEQYPQHTYAESGEYEVTLLATMTDGVDTCTAEATELIIVERDDSDDPRCRVDFDIIQLDEGNHLFGFIDYSEATGEVVSWQWDFGDGATSTEQNPEHQYDAELNENVAITLAITTSDGCEDQVTYELYVGEWENECICDTGYEPVCALDDEGNLIQFGNSCEAECEGFYDHFPCEDECFPHFSWEQSVGDSTNLSVQFFAPVNDNIVSTIWDFGDGNISEETTPLHTYTAAGLYYVTLQIATASGCESVATQSIYVGEGCFCPEFYDPVCVLDPATGELLMFGNHCFAECEGYFDFFHCDDDGGGGEDRGFCQAMFWFNTEDNLTIQFEDLSMTTDETIAWEWDFGDGNTSNEQNPVHVYAEEGIYFVTLTVRDAELCSSRFSMLVWTSEDVFYSEDCRALFFPIIQDNQVILLDVSQGDVASWDWDLGDGTTSNNPFVQHVYDVEGEVTITLKITTEDGCESEFAIVLNLESGNFHGASDPQALSTSTKDFGDVATAISIAPNPTHDLTQLKVNALQAADYQIFVANSTGQVVHQKMGQFIRGEQTVELDLNTLPTGVYMITLRSAGQIWNEKVVKL